MRHMRRKVTRFRAELTVQKLNRFKIGDSFGSLTRYSEAKLLKTPVMGSGTAGQKRKRLLVAIAPDKKKNVKKSRTLHIEGPGPTSGVTFSTLASFIFN